MDTPSGVVGLCHAARLQVLIGALSLTINVGVETRRQTDHGLYSLTAGFPNSRDELGAMVRNSVQSNVMKVDNMLNQQFSSFKG